MQINSAMVRFDTKKGNFIKNESLLKGAAKILVVSGGREALWCTMLEASRNV